MLFYVHVRVVRHDIDGDTPCGAVRWRRAPPSGRQVARSAREGRRERPLGASGEARRRRRCCAVGGRVGLKGAVAEDGAGDVSSVALRATGSGGFAAGDTATRER